MTLADCAFVLWANIASQSDPEKAWPLGRSGMLHTIQHICMLSWNLHGEQELGTCEGLFFPGTLPGPILWADVWACGSWELTLLYQAVGGSIGSSWLLPPAGVRFLGHRGWDVVNILMLPAAEPTKNGFPVRDENNWWTYKGSSLMRGAWRGWESPWLE